MEKVSLASTLSRQHGVQYVFGPQFHEYTAKKAAGILKDTHLKPISEIFTDELQDILVDNKFGENYLGHFSEQLRRKGGSAYKAIGDRLVLKSSSDLAFGEGAENFLKDNEQKSESEIDAVEADQSKAQKDVMRVTESEIEKLAKEQLKNKLLFQSLENGRKFKYDAPVSSQNDFNKLYTKIPKFNEQDHFQ